MRKNTQSKKQLQRNNALLLARLAVRDYYAAYGVKQIYEKLGQDLSLAHIQLLVSGTSENEKVDQIRQLVFDSIQGLRLLGRMIEPESAIAASVDLAEQFHWVFGNELPGVIAETKHVGDKPLAISEILQLYHLACIIKIVLCVKKSAVIVSAAELLYSEKQSTMFIYYAGTKISKQKLIKDWLGLINTSGNLSLFKIQLTTIKNGQNKYCIELTLPYDG